VIPIYFFCVRALIFQVCVTTIVFCLKYAISMFRFPESLIILKSAIVFKSVGLAPVDVVSQEVVSTPAPSAASTSASVPISNNLASQHMSLIDL
jgi:hypothetical protein